MQSEYRVKRIYTEEDGGVVAKCYDILYGEDFEKYLGFPDDFDGKENASNLLQDSTYAMSDELRAEIEELFHIAEFNDEQDYDGYQFFDFDDDFDDEDDDEDEMNQKALAMLGKRESFNLREALNQIDLNTDNKYDLLNLYESCDLKENEKRALANIVYDQEDPSVIYDTLNNRYVSGEEIGMPERVKDGVIHEDEMREGFTYTDTGTNVEVYSDYYIAKKRANELGLKMAEYGDLDDKFSYCFWNESGDRNADEQVLAYYKFVDTVPAPLDEFERQLMLDRYEKGPFDNELDESKSIKEDKSVVDFVGEIEANKNNPEKCDAIYREAEKTLGKYDMNYVTDVYSKHRNVESKSIKESDEETPYTKEEVERELKSITHNFTDKDGDVKCGFEEEKKFGVEILRQHYRIVEVSGDDRREGTWYHISFAEPLNKNESVDPALLGDCPECGDKSFDTKKGKCTKCNYRESLKEYYSDDEEDDYEDYELSPKEIIRILKNHGVIHHMDGDKIMALESYEKLDDGTYKDNFIDVTNYTVHQLRDFLGY